MQNNDQTTILKIEDAKDSNVGPLRRITGLVQTRNLIDLISQEELQANPRRPKQTAITKDIIETLQKSSDMMPFYSKGLLIGCADVQERDRSRFQLHFEDPDREGVLDGGHNLMAIALTLLQLVGVSDSEIRKIKYWNELKARWEKELKEIEALKRNEDSDALNARVPVEIIAPRIETGDGNATAEFNNLILSICANRNQNAQLAADAIANQSGVFDFLKACLPEDLVDEVTWSTNDNKRIDPRMLVSLTWIALGEVPTLSKYDVSPLPPTSAYSTKAEALSRFTKLMKADGATAQTNDGKSYVVIDSYIDSAFEMMPEILECYDIIYKGYKDAYNTTGGAFGRIGAVKKSSKKTNYTVFSNEEVGHEVPPSGFQLPVVFSLRALIKVNKDTQRLEWITPPVEFFNNTDNLQEIILALKPIIEMANWNPQTVGKNAASYNATYNCARNKVLEGLLG